MYVAYICIFESHIHGGDSLACVYLEYLTLSALSAFYNWIHHISQLVIS